MIKILTWNERNLKIDKFQHKNNILRKPMYRIFLNDIWLSKIYKTRHEIIKTYKVLVKNQDKITLKSSEKENQMNFCVY